MKSMGFILIISQNITNTSIGLNPLAKVFNLNLGVGVRRKKPRDLEI